MRQLLAISALAALPCAALAQGGTQQPVPYRGACSKLTVAGDDATASCAAKLVRTSLKDGTDFFIFTGGTTLIGFSGEGASSSALTVRFVNIGLPGREPSPIPANGTCQFGDLRRGPATVTCSAKTEQGAFEGTFRSSGPAR